MPALIRLPAQLQGDLDAWLQLGVKSATGKVVVIRELVTLSDTLREQPIIHKNMLSVNFVMADMAGKVDSRLYGLFKMRGDMAQITGPDGQKLEAYFIHQPDDA